MYGSSSNSVKSCSAASAQQRRALLGRQRVAGRVLEVGDDVRERRPQRPRASSARSASASMPSVSQLDHADVGAAVAQVQQRAVVGRRLDDDRVARLDEQLEQERVGLHRAVGDEHLLRGDAVLLGDPLAQRHVADRRAVGDRAARVVVEGALRGLAQALDVDDVERRRARGRRRSSGRSHGATRASSERVEPRRCRRRSRPPRSASGRRARRCASSASSLAFAVPAGAGDDRARVAHRLAGRRGEAGDVGDDRLGDVLGDVLGGLLLGGAADLAGHHDQLGLGVGLEQRDDVDEARARHRVAADADDRSSCRTRAGPARCRSGRSACRSARRRRRCPP